MSLSPLKKKKISFHGTGVCTQGFVFAKEVLYCVINDSSPFCSGYFNLFFVVLGFELALVILEMGLAIFLSLPTS
jgi:hypothetical protein